MYSPFHKFPTKKSPTRKKESGKSSNNKHTTQNQHSSQKHTNERRPIQSLASTYSQSPNPSHKQSNKRRKGATKAKPTQKTASMKAYRRKRLRLGRATVVLIIAVLLGVGVKWMTVSGFSQLYDHIRADVMQITAKSQPLPYTTGAYLALTRQIELYLQKQPGTFGVSGVDLVTGAQFGWQAHNSFNTAQTLALPVVIDLYSQIANRQLSPQTIVHVQNTDKQAGSGFIGGLPQGTALTVTQLAHAAIVNGDVVAINMLIRKLGPAEIDSFMSSVGSHETLSDPKLLTPYDLTLYLSYLYSMNQAHPHSLAPLMMDLTQVQQNNRIAAGLSTHSKILQVTGDWPNEFHNAAIFQVHHHPIALAICSNGVTETQANLIEAHISHLVEQFVSQPPN